MLCRYATASLLVALLAVPGFAQNGPKLLAQASVWPDLNSSASLMRAVSNSSAPVGATETALPSPSTVSANPNESLAASMPSASERPSIAREAYRQLDSQEPQSPKAQMAGTATSEHHIRKAPLAVAIVGVAVAGFGTFLMAESRNKGIAAAFLAPGAAAAGFGFYFAFRH